MVSVICSELVFAKENKDGQYKLCKKVEVWKVSYYRCPHKTAVLRCMCILDGCFMSRKTEMKVLNFHVPLAHNLSTHSKKWETQISKREVVFEILCIC